MKPEQLENVKCRLEEMLADLRSAVETRSEATVIVQLDTSMGRLSRIDAIQSQQMALGLKARQHQAILRVQNALEAVRNGTYGNCRRCKQPIGLERLEAQPDAVLCVSCAEAGAKR